MYILHRKNSLFYKTTPSLDLIIILPSVLSPYLSFKRLPTQALMDALIGYPPTPLGDADHNARAIYNLIGFRFNFNFAAPYYHADKLISRRPTEGTPYIKVCLVAIFITRGS